MISVTVLLFAAHREIVGSSRIELEVPDRVSVHALYHRLVGQYPELLALQRSTTFAVNREVAPSDRIVHSGDEVAFLLPVSGG